MSSLITKPNPKYDCICQDILSKSSSGSNDESICCQFFKPPDNSRCSVIVIDSHELILRTLS